MPISGCHDLPLATFNLPSRVFRHGCRRAECLERRWGGFFHTLGAWERHRGWGAVAVYPEGGCGSMCWPVDRPATHAAAGAAARGALIFCFGDCFTRSGATRRVLMRCLVWRILSRALSRGGGAVSAPIEPLPPPSARLVRQSRCCAQTPAGALSPTLIRSPSSSCPQNRTSFPPLWKRRGRFD